MSLLELAFSLIGKSPPHQAVPASFKDMLTAGKYTEAVDALKKECAQGSAEAMVTLGVLYSRGEGVTKSEEEASLWYRQAAVRGNVSAQALLGLNLARGRGIEANAGEAAYWLYQAARAGSGEALDWLSELMLQAPDVVGEHFEWKDVTHLLKARGLAHMLSRSN